MSVKEKLTYKQALIELEDILNRIENSNLEVDQLSEKIKRASFLLKSCKQMLRSAEEVANTILNNIEDN